MSAVPVPLVVVAGTSDLPSSVAFILSAKAGPAKATVAPSANVASMVLVFDMVFSLLASSHGVRFKTVSVSKRCQFQNNATRNLFPETAQTPKILGAVYGRICSHTSHRNAMDRDGLVMLRRILPSFILAGVVGFGVYWWLTAKPTTPARMKLGRIRRSITS